MAKGVVRVIISSNGLLIYITSSVVAEGVFSGVRDLTSGKIKATSPVPTLTRCFFRCLGLGRELMIWIVFVYSSKSFLTTYPLFIHITSGVVAEGVFNGIRD